MKQIKFRAWDKKRKKILYSDFCIVPTQPTWGAFNYDSNISHEIGQIYLQKGQDSMIAKTGDYSVFDWADYYGLNEYELMQFTGLLDKNGKEIYEGDIIRPSNVHLRYFKPTVVIDKYQVEWLDSDGVYFVSDPPCNAYIALGDVEELGELEIIGNIHENSELLGEGK